MSLLGRGSGSSSQQDRRRQIEVNAVVKRMFFIGIF
jgi:hypothetical protein